MENSVKQYVTDAQATWEELKAQIDAEFVKQNRRANRASETRLRGLLRDVQKRLYIPYRDSSLKDSKGDEGAEGTVEV